MEAQARARGRRGPVNNAPVADARALPKMDLLGEWSRSLLAGLRAFGVRNFIVSPGSRSTPLVWALSELAAGDPLVRVTSMIDEREAGFFALGQGKLSGVPSCLVCTSGTAAANYFPAVIEASQSFTPLVVLSADRPFRLLNTGANQTMDQTDLFGRHARSFLDLGEPTAHAFATMRDRVDESLEKSMYPLPGVVHLNARFDKPLSPKLAKPGDASQASAGIPANSRLGVARSRTTPNLTRLLEAIDRAERPVLFAGPMPASARSLRPELFRWLARSGILLAAEAASQFRFCERPSELLGIDRFDALLSSDAFTPDLLLQLGSVPVSGAYNRFIQAHPEVERWVLTEHGWPDPAKSASGVLRADLSETIPLLGEQSTPNRASAWAQTTAGTELPSPPGETLTEAGAVCDLVATLGEAEAPLLFVGNSLSIRHLDRWASCASDIRVLSQRGVSGIDGLVSGAAGAASLHEGPSALLLGDVSLLHGIGGLLSLRSCSRPIVVVVLNNDGGRIFEQLPIAQETDDLDLWTTPHGLGFESAAKMYGLRYRRPTDRSGLRTALGEALGVEGPTLVEVVCDAATTARLSRELDGAGAEAAERIAMVV